MYIFHVFVRYYRFMVQSSAYNLDNIITSDIFSITGDIFAAMHASRKTI